MKGMHTFSAMQVLYSCRHLNKDCTERMFLRDSEMFVHKLRLHLFVQAKKHVCYYDVTTKSLAFISCETCSPL